MHSIPLQAFCPRISQEEKEEATKYALQKATKYRERQRELATRNQLDGHDNSSGSEEECPGATRRGSDHNAFAITKGEEQFFLNLKLCLPLTTI